MSLHAQRPLRLESLLSALLRYGTWTATALIAIGLGVGSFGTMELGTGLVEAGIAGFILLPVLRLIVMLIGFLWDRDYRFVAITVMVLLIIGSACAIAAISTHAPAHDNNNKPSIEGGVGPHEQSQLDRFASRKGE